MSEWWGEKDGARGKNGFEMTVTASIADPFCPSSSCRRRDGEASWCR